MGLLVNGRWSTRPHASDEDGRFVRTQTQFRHWVTPDGASGFTPEAGRYHLYVSLACPWAHRTLIYRSLKKLEAAISVSVVEPLMAESGWAFGDVDGAVPDSVDDAQFLHQV